MESFQFLKDWKQPPEVFYKTGILKGFTKFNLIRPSILLKETDAGVFLRNLQNFQEHLFYRTPLDDCFPEHLKKVVSI